MSEAVLRAIKREETGKGAMRKLRAGGRIPAVVYGHHFDVIKLSLDGKEVDDLFRTISIESTVINLEIDGGSGKGPVKALVREVQRHPYRDRLLHLDFYQISMEEAVTVQVPITLQGTPAGVRNEGGILQHQMRDITISCLPADIPEHFEVDVSALSIGDSIHIRDLRVEGFQVLSDPEGLVATVLPPTIIKEEIKPEVAVMEPEVIGKEKPEEGEEPAEQKGAAEKPERGE